MTIHTVSAGETVHSISELYGVPESRIVTDNALGPTSKLLQGRSLLISKPQSTCTVRGGDTLQGIAERHGVSLLSLLQNNPQLCSGRILPSQVLSIAFETEYAEPIVVSAYTGTASIAQIEACLPYITYLHVQNAVFLQNGEVSLLENAAPLVSLATRYHAESILTVDTADPLGDRSSRKLTELLTSPVATERFIGSLTSTAEKNGFRGVEVQFFCAEDGERAQLNELLIALEGVCKEKGLLLSLPTLPEAAEGTPLDLGDLSLLWSYVWDNTAARSPVAPLDRMYDTLSEPHRKPYLHKTLLGIPTFAIEYGQSGKKILSVDTLPELGTVKFDAVTQTPFLDLPASRDTRGHLLCFEDVRSYAEKLALVAKFGLGGINVMSLSYDAPVFWKLLNQSFSIRKAR